jgi:hypothetical protein
MRCGDQNGDFAQVGDLIQVDLHRYCHTREGIGHALQAGRPATGSFFPRPGKRRQQENACNFNQSSNSCVLIIRNEFLRNCVQVMRYNCYTFSGDWGGCSAVFMPGLLGRSTVVFEAWGLSPSCCQMISWPRPGIVSRAPGSNAMHNEEPVHCSVAWNFRSLPVPGVHGTQISGGRSADPPSRSAVAQ